MKWFSSLHQVYIATDYWHRKKNLWLIGVTKNIDGLQKKLGLDSWTHEIIIVNQTRNADAFLKYLERTDISYKQTLTKKWYLGEKENLVDLINDIMRSPKLTTEASLCCLS